MLDLSVVDARAVELISRREALGFLSKFQAGFFQRVRTIHDAFA